MSVGHGRHTTMYNMIFFQSWLRYGFENDLAGDIFHKISEHSILRINP